jgi:hypothetical protein
MPIWYPSRPRAYRRLSYNNKILARLEKNSIQDPITGCKLWLGGQSGNGHGQISFNNKTTLIHRLIMHIMKDFDLNSKNNINHIRECKNKNCWNIDHLYEGNQQDNMNDREANTTHCSKGHEYTVENTYLWHDREANKFRKNCRTCHNERERNSSR